MSTDIVKLDPVLYSQRDGEVRIETEEGYEIVVTRENVPTLLMIVVTALRTGDYSAEQLDACAKTCKANLFRYLK